jgi:hypothetical protein
MTMEGESGQRMRLRSRWAGLCIAAAILPVYLLFRHLGLENIGYVVTCITGVFLMAIYVNRSSMLNSIFVAVTLVLYVIHIVLILELPIPSNIPSYIMIPIALVDGVIVLSILHFIERRLA